MKIAIVGGVAGGASAACRARRLDESAEIVLFEKDRDIAFANCGMPYHLGREEIPSRSSLVVATKERLEKRFNINVKTFTQVTAINVTDKTLTTRTNEGVEATESWDKLILATGAAPVIPRLPGADGPNVFTLRNLEDMDKIDAALTPAKSAVIVGGGFIGIELAEQFTLRGLSVSIVELLPRLLINAVDPEFGAAIEDRLRSNGVNVITGDGLAAVDSTGVTLRSGKHIPGDVVIMAIGVRPAVELPKAAGVELATYGGVSTDHLFETSAKDVFAVGDVAEYEFGPKDTHIHRRAVLAGPANRAARTAAEAAVYGREKTRSRDLVMGTGITRVFDLAIGTTGVKLSAAANAGYPNADAVTIVTKSSAGYHSAARPIHLKLVYDALSGLILGAQVMGEAGVDKRVDVIATMLAMEGTVQDLAGLDLAYSPPYGSAKDPLHMAAFAAMNAIDGLVKFVQPGADLSGFDVTLDVRGTEEEAKAPLPSPGGKVIVIPVDDLRPRLAELEEYKDKRIVVSCASGLRAYVAARVLMQKGWSEVFVLSGSYKARALVLAGDVPKAGAKL